MTKAAPSVPKEALPKPTRKTATPKPTKSGVSESKDLGLLIKKLSEQNAPETSKDITAFAKTTIKLVGQSQKSDSLSFKREATSSLIKFRDFVEKSNKLTDVRRNKLLSDIDSVTLDTKNASRLLLSVAHTHAGMIENSAKDEAKLTKLRAANLSRVQLSETKSINKQSILKASLEAKSITDKAVLDSKARKAEEKLKIKDIIESTQIKVNERKADQRAKYDKLTLDIKDRAATKKAEDNIKMKSLIEAAHIKTMERKADQRAKYDKLTLDIKDRAKANKDKQKARNDQTLIDIKDRENKGKADLLSRKIGQENQNVVAKLKIKRYRDDSADQVKMIKIANAARVAAKMKKARDYLVDRKLEQNNATRARIQRIKDYDITHKAKLKKIQDDAKEEGIIRKIRIQDEQSKIKAAKDKRDKKSSEFTGKLTSGATEANPLLHAAVEIGEGVASSIGKAMDWNRDRKERKGLTGTRANRGGSNPPPAPPGGATGGLNGPPPPPPAAGGGMFDGLLSLIPSVMGVASSIFGVFKTIGKFAGKIGPMLGGIKAIPIIGTAVTVVMGIFDFIEGFNNATALFGETVGDGDYVKRIFSGFTNAFASILGIFDTIAGWLGFDTDIKGKFQDGAVALFKNVSKIVDDIVGWVGGIFNSIGSTIRQLATGIANILVKLPFVDEDSSSVKGLRSFAGGGDKKTPPVVDKPVVGVKSSTPVVAVDKPAVAPKIAEKQNQVNNLKDSANQKSNSVAVVNTDNSVKSSNTTIIQQKMTTRNDDPYHQRFGYGIGTVV